MYLSVINKVSTAGVNKARFAKKAPLKYLVASALAGAYVGLGILLIFTIGGQLSPSQIPFTKIIMGMSFGIALSLVIMAGAELFTGNNLVMSISTLNKETKANDLSRVWIISYIGNFVGSAFIAFLFVQSGLASGSVLEFFNNVSIAKTSNSISHLIFAGMLCNILVCLAVWSSIKLESETAKLIMIWWCLFAFITAGFEHSVANMTIFMVSLLSKSSAITVSAMGYNLLWVTVGNLIGGVLLGSIYFYISHEKKDN